MNADIITNLIRASRCIPIIPNEDAYVTGVLAKEINATKYGIGKGYLPYTHNKPPTICEASLPNFYAGTTCSADCMAYIYDSFTQQFDCTQEQ